MKRPRVASLLTPQSGTGPFEALGAASGFGRPRATRMKLNRVLWPLESACGPLRTLDERLHWLPPP